jgi:hypothetical protein
MKHIGKKYISIKKIYFFPIFISYTKISVNFTINPDTFDMDYEKNYINYNWKNTIRDKIGLDKSVKIKKNGSWTRNLYYFSSNNTIRYTRVKILKYQWIDEFNEKHYISVFPDFIIRWCSLSCEILDLVSNLGKGENLFNYINDFYGLIDSGDEIIDPASCLEKRIIKNNFIISITLKIATTFDVIPSVNKDIVDTKYFPNLFTIFDIAEKFLYTKCCVFTTINHNLYI